MSEVQKLKQTCTTALCFFMRVKTILVELSILVLKAMFSYKSLKIDLRICTRHGMNAVQEKHEQYILQLDETGVDKIQSEEEWMAEIDSEYDHAEAQKLDYIRERENAKKEVSQNENTMANSKEVRQGLRRRNIEEATS